MMAQRLMTPAEIIRDRNRWQELRLTGITASDVPAMLGISRHGNPFALFVAKSTGKEMTGDTDAAARGRHLEPYVAEVFASTHPELAVLDGGLYRSKERPWQMATFDRLAVDLDLLGLRHRKELRHTGLVETKEAMRHAFPVQIKTAHTRQPGDNPQFWWGDSGTDQIPVDYRAQCLQEMDVSGASMVIVPCRFMDTWQQATYIITRDEAVDADIEAIRGEAEMFRARLANDDPPDIDWTPATTRALRTLHPVARERTIKIPVTLACRYRAARQSVKRADRRLSKVVNEILLRAGDAKYVVIEVDGEEIPVAARLQYGKWHVPAAALRDKYPRIVKELEEETPVDALFPARWAKQ